MRSKGQKTGGRFRYQFVDPVTGRRRSVYAKTQAALDLKMRKVQEARDGIRHGLMTVNEVAMTLRPALGIGLRVRDVWARYQPGVRECSSTSAGQVWRHMIEPYLGNKLAAELDESVMREWVTTLERTRRGRGGTTYAPKTVRLAFVYLASAIRQAVRARPPLLHEVPWGEWKPNIGNEPRYEREGAASVEELQALFQAAKDEDFARWDRKRYSAEFFTVVTLGLSAMRQAEAAGLGWDCLKIDDDKPRVHIRYQATRHWQSRNPGADRPMLIPKGKRARWQLLHPSVVVVLQMQREQLKKFGWYREDGPVFPGVEGRWRESGQVIRPQSFRRLVATAGLPNVKAWSPHSLRHSCASLEAIASGGDIRWVMSRTGHRDIQQLETYIHRMGRGLTGSKIPELPLAMMGGMSRDIVANGATISEVTKPRELGTGAGLSQVVPKPTALGPEAMTVSDSFTRQAIELPWEAKRRRQRALEDREKTFPELAAEWVAMGSGPGTRPKAVTEAIGAAYRRGYQRARYDGVGKDEAKMVGRRARRASLGAWGKALVAAGGRVPMVDTAVADAVCEVSP